MINKFKPENMMDCRDRMDDKWHFEISCYAEDNGHGFPAIIESVKDFNEGIEFAVNYLRQWHYDDKISVTIRGYEDVDGMGQLAYELEMVSKTHDLKTHRITDADYQLLQSIKKGRMPEGEPIVGTYMKEV